MGSLANCAQRGCRTSCENARTPRNEVQNTAVQQLRPRCSTRILALTLFSSLLGPFACYETTLLPSTPPGLPESALSLKSLQKLDRFQPCPKGNPAIAIAFYRM